MTRQVKPGSAGDRILRLLLKRHPITEDEVALALGLRKDVVRLETQRLAAQGLVVVESPGGTARYVTLSGAGFQLLGATSRERAERRQEKDATSTPPRDEHDPAFM